MSYYPQDLIADPTVACSQVETSPSYYLVKKKSSILLAEMADNTSSGWFFILGFNI